MQNIDFFKYLQEHPDLLAMAKSNPLFVPVMSESRKQSLIDLIAADLPDSIKRLLLDLELENVPHEIGTCLVHFLGVFDIMKACNQSDEVAYVGLFHAIYGTNFNPLQVLKPGNSTHRNWIRSVLGVETEKWIYIYAVADVAKFVDQTRCCNDFLHFTDFNTGMNISMNITDAHALSEVLVANAYDPYKSTNDNTLLPRVSYFEPLRPLVSAGAQGILTFAANE